MQDVVIGGKHHQHEHQTQPYPEPHLLRPIRQRTSPDEFDRVEQKMTTVEQRHRKQVQQPDRYRENRGKMDQRRKTNGGDLAGNLRNPQRTADLVGCLTPCKDAADKGAFMTKVDSQNYPPDLEELVKGVDVQGKKVKFLRKIPVDPMTGKAEWGLHSMQDDPTSDSYGGQSVFDVYSKSDGTALDGTKYKDW